MLKMLNGYVNNDVVELIRHISPYMLWDTFRIACFSFRFYGNCTATSQNLDKNQLFDLINSELAKGTNFSVLIIPEKKNYDAGR